MWMKSYNIYPRFKNLSLLALPLRFNLIVACIGYFFLLLYSIPLNIPQFVPLSMMTFGLLGCNMSLCRRVLPFSLYKDFELPYLGHMVDVKKSMNCFPKLYGFTS